MSDEDDIQEEEEGGVDGTVTLMLGLYLIVLAFFILLNAIAEFVDEKVEEVSQSVGEGFGFDMSGKMRMKENVESQMAPVFKLMSQEVQGIMESYISVKNYRFMQDDGDMRLTIDADSFFEEGAVRIRPAQVAFFADAAKLIERPRPGMVMDCDVMVTSTMDSGIAAKMSPMDLAGRRATIFARALINKGVNPAHVSAAAIDAEKDEVLLNFYVRVKDPAKALKHAEQLKMQEAIPADVPRPPQAAPIGAVGSTGPVRK